MIHGLDFTQEILEIASEKSLYRRLSLSDPEAEFPVKPGDYAAIVTIGVIGAGAAPVKVFDMLLNALETGKKFVFFTTIIPLNIRCLKRA